MTRTDHMTIGSDVEYFVARPLPKKPPPKAKMSPEDESDSAALRKVLTQREKRNGPEGDINKIVPCVGLCPGTKAKPFTPTGWLDGYAVQEDNVMLEVNVPVSVTPIEFGRSIQQVNQYAKQFMKVHNLIPIFSLSEHTFRPKDLTSPQAMNFACDPDFDAYAGGAERTTQPEISNLRTCGGHVHVGGDFKCPDWVAVLFFELGLYQAYGSEYICPSQTQRRNWYGRPGTFRPKPYGLEYRTLGNWWSTNRGSAEDLAHNFFRTGNWLIQTPSQVIQSCFRTIQWTLMQKILLLDYINEEGVVDLKELKKDRITFMNTVSQARMGI